MNFFEQELRKLAAACDELTNPVFAGRACYGDLGGGTRVKLQFVTLGYADHYEALKATVLNRSEGEVDTLLFRLGDIWGSKPVSNPNFREGVKPHIWADRGKNDWYVYRPTNADYRQLANAVGAYIGVFADRTPEHRKEQAQDSVVEKLREAKQQPLTPKKSADHKKSGPER